MPPSLVQQVLGMPQWLAWLADQNGAKGLGRVSAFVGGLQQLPVLQRVDTASQCAGLSAGVAHHQVLRRDVTRFLKACGTHQVSQGVQCVGMKVIHPLGFVGHHQGKLAHRVLGGHAGGAVVGVAAA